MGVEGAVRLPPCKTETPKRLKKICFKAGSDDLFHPNGELGITVSVGDVFTEVVHEYPDITVYLTLFNATISSGIPKLLEHNDSKWITQSEIPNYTFCPADKDILKELTRK